MNPKQKPETPISFPELTEMVKSGALYIHHSAYFSGYVSRTRKDEDIIGYHTKGCGSYQLQTN